MTAAEPDTMRQIAEREQRLCPHCSYPVQNPFTDRCPRCLAAMPAAEPHCASCLVAGNCGFAHTAQTPAHQG
jgi:hypothetical protein